MALTLAEAKVGMADHIDQQIVDTLRRESRHRRVLLRS